MGSQTDFSLGQYLPDITQDSFQIPTGQPQSRLLNEQPFNIIPDDISFDIPRHLRNSTAWPVAHILLSGDSILFQIPAGDAGVDGETYLLDDDDSFLEHAHDGMDNTLATPFPQHKPRRSSLRLSELTPHRDTSPQQNSDKQTQLSDTPAQAVRRSPHKHVLCASPLLNTPRHKLPLPTKAVPSSPAFQSRTPAASPTRPTTCKTLVSPSPSRRTPTGIHTSSIPQFRPQSRSPTKLSQGLHHIPGHTPAATPRRAKVSCRNSATALPVARNDLFGSVEPASLSIAQLRAKVQNLFNKSTAKTSVSDDKEIDKHARAPTLEGVLESCAIKFSDVGVIVQ
jgi:hypothetical protein